MAFRASNELAPAALTKAKQTANSLKSQCNSWVTIIADSGADANQVLGLLRQLKQIDSTFAAISATPGLAAYAIEYENDGAYDVVAEFTAMRNAIAGAINLIVTAVPADANGYLLTHTLDANDNIVPRHFTSTNLANLSTALQNISDNIS